MTSPIASFSLSARITLNMHSLNNEGTEGNTTKTRQTHIVGSDGHRHFVNAISGDMWKHIQTEHFFELARDEHLALCSGCARFDANRINADQDWIDAHPTTHAGMLSDLLTHCAIDDTAGVLIAQNGRHLARKSVVEFGWVLGMPEQVITNSYLHARYALPEDNTEDDTTGTEPDQASTDGANLGQMIYYQPASSGIYALASHVELWRVGYNEALQSYVLPEDERRLRAGLVLQSLLHTVLEPRGAMRSTELPHLMALEGILTWSTQRSRPAPMASALIGGQKNPAAYQDLVETITQALNRHRTSAGSHLPAITAQRFGDLGEFATQMSDLIDQVLPAVQATS